MLQLNNAVQPDPGAQQQPSLTGQLLNLLNKTGKCASKVSELTASCVECSDSSHACTHNAGWAFRSCGNLYRSHTCPLAVLLLPCSYAAAVDWERCSQALWPLLGAGVGVRKGRAHHARTIEEDTAVHALLINTRATFLDVCINKG